MIKLSKYVKTVQYNNDIALYNTINHAVMQLPKEAVNEGYIIAELDDESVEILHDSYFFDATDTTVANSLSSFLLNEKKLFISLELNLSCNLRCPYCYQAGAHDGKIISDEVLDSLAEYVQIVHQKTPIEDLFIKILGGEPTLVWKKFMKVYDALLDFCNRNSIRFHLLVDTNGTRIEDLKMLEGYDSLLLTIPLTYKECHDKVRFDAKGNGTYDVILSNINEFHRIKPDAKIVIRYNVDGENCNFFKSFLCDISAKLQFKPLVSVNYTAELGDVQEYKNKMTYLDFVEWSSSVAIDDLIAAEMPITISPIISIEECQFRSKYSLKLFSDGTVGSCAMSFFDKDRMTIRELIDNFSVENEFVAKKNKQTILADTECMQCDGIFMCGGTNKLPCIKALNPNLCADKVYNINLQQFVARYLECVETGTSGLFVVFEDGESYR